MEPSADAIALQGTSSAVVIAGARSGDAASLSALYRLHAQALLSVAYRILLSRDDAEDVVHDVFVGLPEALRKYEERGSFTAWIKRITVRVALSRLRAERVHEALPEIAAARRDPLDRMAIDHALAALTPALRAVVVLREVEGYSHAEIGSMLGISRAASEVRLHRALRLMRRHMSEED